VYKIIKLQFWVWPASNYKWRIEPRKTYQDQEAIWIKPRNESKRMKRNKNK